MKLVDKKRGRRYGQKAVPKEAYPEIARRSKTEFLSSIAKDFDIAPRTVARIAKRYDDEHRQ